MSRRGHTSSNAAGRVRLEGTEPSRVMVASRKLLISLQLNYWAIVCGRSGVYSVANLLWAALVVVACRRPPDPTWSLIPGGRELWLEGECVAMNHVARGSFTVMAPTCPLGRPDPKTFDTWYRKAEGFCKYQAVGDDIYRGFARLGGRGRAHTSIWRDDLEREVWLRVEWSPTSCEVWVTDPPKRSVFRRGSPVHGPPA